jgi:hypothetical protein
VTSPRTTWLARLAPVLLGSLAIGLCGPATYDQLQCFKIKDPLKLKGVVDVRAVKFGLDPGCKIGKPKLYCSKASKLVHEAFDGKDPIDLSVVLFGPEEQDSICYKVKCPRRAVPDASVTDLFGTRTLSKLKSSMVCAPAVKPNDECTDATRICGPGPRIVHGTTFFATQDTLPDNCQTALTGQVGVWYEVIGTGALISADTCGDGTNFDTMISVYTGGCGALQCVGGDDDGCGVANRSSITWTSQIGVSYLVYVHGFEAATGDFQLEISAAAPCE